MPFDVFFYEAFAEEAPALQRALPASVRAAFSARAIQEEDHPLPPAALISIRTQSEIPDRWLPALRGVLARTTGYDHLFALRRRAGPSLAVSCLDEYCSRAVAEQALLLWMALLRRLPGQLTQFAEFSRDHLTGAECAGRTLVVAGVGRIGGEVCRIGSGLGMRVLGVDIVQRHPEITYAAPRDAFSQADIVVNTMNLTAENRGYFTPDCLNDFKRGALFINVARGEHAPAGNLLRALDEGVLSGMALDVFTDESSLAVSLRAHREPDAAEGRYIRELSLRPNVLLTPHNAFNTEEALARKARFSAEEVVHFQAHGAFRRPFPG
jgi:D-lactate dehydrogenase